MSCQVDAAIFITYAIYVTLLALGGFAGGILAGYVIAGYVKGMPKE